MLLNEPSRPQGTQIGEYLRSLVESNPCILALSVVRYCHPPSIDLRAPLSAMDVARLDRALALRKRDGMPFWDAVMLSCFNQPSTPEGLLRAALFHQSTRANQTFVPRATILASGVNGALASVDGIVAAGSAILISGETDRHLPLLDFHCKETCDHDRLVRSVCRVLFGCTTVVCRSGESYHAYGLMTVTSDELRRFLTTALLFAPIVDRAYVAHQLMEGYCALRIGAAPNKPLQPEVKFIVRQEI
jgi:hypothetical protein